jgi:hypothetical protein
MTRRLSFSFLGLAWFALTCGDSSPTGGGGPASAGGSGTSTSTSTSGSSGAGGSGNAGGNGDAGGGAGTSGGTGVDAGEICPADTPLSGSPCSIEDLHCFYCAGPKPDGGCSFPLDVVCIEGKWRVPR